MNTKRITQSAALGLVLAAGAAPASGAQQEIRMPDQIAPSPEMRQEYVAPATDERQDFRHPDTIDAAAGRGTDSSPDVVVVKIPAQAPSAAVSADGLDWQDAGIGAGGLLALGLIGLGGTLLVVHHRRGAAPTPHTH
jgi:hypothetical protein